MNISQIDASLVNGSQASVSQVISTQAIASKVNISQVNASRVTASKVNIAPNTTQRVTNVANFSLQVYSTYSINLMQGAITAFNTVLEATSQTSRTVRFLGTVSGSISDMHSVSLPSNGEFTPAFTQSARNSPISVALSTLVPTTLNEGNTTGT